jgi:hypothetical protein
MSSACSVRNTDKSAFRLKAKRQPPLGQNQLFHRFFGGFPLTPKQQIPLNKDSAKALD